jgi:hypothetical protein
MTLNEHGDMGFAYGETWLANPQDYAGIVRSRAETIAASV